MGVKILIAGCSKEDREGVSAFVRKAFAERPSDEPWSVSLVKIANQWSVEIDGPEPRFKGLSLVAPSEDLTGSLRRALAAAGNAGAEAAALPAPQPAEGERNDRYACEGCSAGFAVIYLAAPGEREELCPVACPQCWHVNHVPIAAGAGLNGHYRAEATSG